jgi:glycosyltransferase involved in cell wall biosynthesis
MTTAKVVHMTSVHGALDPRIFHKECRSLARAGFEVTVIGHHSQDMVADRVRIESVYRHPSRLARMTRTVWHVYRKARSQKADVYHFHDPELIPVGLLLRASGKKVIYDIHEDMPKDVMSKSYLPVWSRPLVAWMTKHLEGMACGYFSALVVVTPSIADRFARLNMETVIIHNYPYQNEVVLDLASAKWDSRRQSVAYVGGITAQRAIREMVAAMGLLPTSLPATLELAGNEIPEDVRAEELRADPGWARVHHHGLLDQPSTFKILHKVRAGMVVFHPEPNHLESLPQKIFEYMGAGLPIVASDFPLWRRILGEEGCQCALFVDPRNSATIARAIEYILMHPAEAEAMGRRGQAALLKYYNWDSEAAKLVQLYLGLTKSTCAA